MLFLTLTELDGRPVQVVVETIGAIRHPSPPHGTEVCTTVGRFEVRETPEAIQQGAAGAQRAIRERAVLLGAPARPAAVTN